MPKNKGILNFQTIFIGWVPRNFFKKDYSIWLLSKLSKPMTRAILAMNAYVCPLSIAEEGPLILPIDY